MYFLFFFFKKGVLNNCILLQKILQAWFGYTPIKQRQNFVFFRFTIIYFLYEKNHTSGIRNGHLLQYEKRRWTHFLIMNTKLPWIIENTRLYDRFIHIETTFSYICFLKVISHEDFILNLLFSVLYFMLIL